MLEKEFNCLSGYTVDSSQVRHLYLGQNPFNGTLDEITLYPRAMPADEVRQRYEQGRPHWQVYLPIISR